MLEKNIKNARNNANLTQAQLAQKMGISQARIADWENGKVDIKVSSLIALAKALEVEPGELLK